MKKMFRHIVMVAVAMLALSSLTSCNYNSLVEKRENADQQWAQVENVYQRRADLIPNLVNTVKGYASHESETLQAVVEARAKATSINIDPKNLDEASLKKFQDAASSCWDQAKEIMGAERYDALMKVLGK